MRGLLPPNVQNQVAKSGERFFRIFLSNPCLVEGKPDLLTLAKECISTILNLSKTRSRCKQGPQHLWRLTTLSSRFELMACLEIMRHADISS